MNKITMWWVTVAFLCLGFSGGCGAVATKEVAPGAPMEASAARAPAAEASLDDLAMMTMDAAPTPSLAKNEAEGPEPLEATLSNSGDARLAQAVPAGAPKQPAATTEPADDPSEPPKPAPTASDAVAGPLLIYTANLNLGVFETTKSIDAVETAAREAGGYLVIRDEATITVRVPSARFDEVLKKAMALGDVLARNVEVRDVTDEYYDLQTRLRNQEAVLERLKELLERADTVEDALKVEAQLGRVAAEVEQIKGRLKLLRELVTFSTIIVRFQPTAVEDVGGKVTLPFPWLGTLGLGSLLRL
ncbi:MAG: DUF4349 domain-containing protein [Polyangiaceae bacterium]|nr:DUF4349 domain-containing protein [Polyangiaceae bacterium]